VYKYDTYKLKVTGMVKKLIYLLNNRKYFETSNTCRRRGRS